MKFEEIKEKVGHAVKKKVIALLLCLVFVAFLVLSFLFLTVYALHDCTKTSCRICLKLNDCITFLLRLTVPIGGAFILLLVPNIVIQKSFVVLKNMFLTLTSLKVKLS